MGTARTRHPDVGADRGRTGRRGQFEQAFAKVYGGTPAELVPNWSARAGKRGR